MGTFERPGFVSCTARPQALLACTVVDVRTPAEFKQGHIPGALNVPLLIDEQWAELAAAYKEEQRRRGDRSSGWSRKLTDRALQLTAEHGAPRLFQGIAPLHEGDSSSSASSLALVCDGLGARSRAAAWLLAHLSLLGRPLLLLEGGYPAFRRWVARRNNFVAIPGLRVLGGYTGSNKTAILRALQARGEAVLDLEAAARHCGSVFGAFSRDAGEKEPQPTQEQFENDLAAALHRLSPEASPGDVSPRVWIEDESRAIGRVYVPPGLFQKMGGGVPAGALKAAARAAGEDAAAGDAAAEAALVAAAGSAALPQPDRPFLYFLHVPRKERLARVVSTYGPAAVDSAGMGATAAVAQPGDAEVACIESSVAPSTHPVLPFVQAVERLQPRLGSERASAIIRHLWASRLAPAAAALLGYYDATYQHAFRRKEPGAIAAGHVAAVRSAAGGQASEGLGAGRWAVGEWGEGADSPVTSAPRLLFTPDEHWDWSLAQAAEQEADDTGEEAHACDAKETGTLLQDAVSATEWARLLVELDDARTASLGASAIFEKARGDAKGGDGEASAYSAVPLEALLPQQVRDDPALLAKLKAATVSAAAAAVDATAPPPPHPRLVVFAGPMWAAKTDRLIAHATRVIEGHFKLPGSSSSHCRTDVTVIKTAVDTRHLVAGGGPSSQGATSPPLYLQSRTGRTLRVDVVVQSLDEVAAPPPAPGVHRVWVVDEAQFLGASLTRFWSRVVAPDPASCLVVAGLDRDFRGQPFGDVTTTLPATVVASEGAAAVKVELLTATCACCGQPATLTQRLVPASLPAPSAQSVVLIGDGEAYQPVCAAHHHPSPLTREAWLAMCATAASSPQPAA